MLLHGEGRVTISPSLALAAFAGALIGYGMGYIHAWTDERRAVVQQAKREAEAAAEAAEAARAAAAASRNTLMAAKAEEDRAVQLHLAAMRREELASEVLAAKLQGLLPPD